MRLIYTEEAVADLVRLRAFIAKWSPDAARRMGTNLVKRIKNIGAFPEMGRSVVEAQDPEAVRDAFFGRYVVRYAVHANVVAILRIWHHLEDRSADS